MTYTPEQQALVWRIGERIADEVEKAAHGRQSDCEAAAGDIYAMLTRAPSAEGCEWPTDRTFGFHDKPGEHDPCYVIMPDGAMLPFNHHAAPGVDIARAQFVQAACNAALTATAKAEESSASPGDIAWLRGLKENGHCGEGTLDRRMREQRNDRIDRLLAATAEARSASLLEQRLQHAPTVFGLINRCCFVTEDSRHALVIDTAKFMAEVRALATNEVPTPPKAEADQ